MTFKFIFTFPEVENIEDIDMIVEMDQLSNNILNLVIPALHKPLGQENFIGWEIEKVIGDLELLQADEILTKNNLIQFSIKSNQEYYETTIYCKMKWSPMIALCYEWGEFNTIVHLTIDTSNPNPKTCCTYIGTSSSLNYEDWDTFFGHYPVLLKDGIEIVKLNPNNYNEDINGNNVDIESGNAGDVMIAFPCRGLRISKDNGIISISFTTAQDDNKYQYYAHTYNERLDKFYIGAYSGFIDNNGCLRSLSNKIPTTKKTCEDFRQAAQLNGNGYEQFAFYQLVYLQAMFIMKYKTLSGQTILGTGQALSPNEVPKSLTGVLNTKGLDYKNSGEGMKFAGIENFWGYVGNFIDGILSFRKDGNPGIAEVHTAINNFSDYKDYNFCCTIPTTLGIMSDCVGTSEGGFIPIEDQAPNIDAEIRASSYFCSYAGVGSIEANVSDSVLSQTNCFGFAKYAIIPLTAQRTTGLFSLHVGLYHQTNGWHGLGARLQKL